MKQFVFVIMGICLLPRVSAQEKKPGYIRTTPKPELTDIRKCIRSVQGNLALYTQNYGNHSQEHDVNTIILDIEKYIDSAMPKNKSYSDQLLIKQFNPLRHFFLTTANKTSVATSFLYSGNPYQFCYYNDSALTLYLYAIKDGSTYDLGKKTDKRIIKTALESCLLPSLKALDEFKADEIKYVAMSIYYGCKDTREGAPTTAVSPYCLTFVARLADVQQYEAGLITVKGLLANAAVYLCDSEDYDSVRSIPVSTE